MIAAHDRHLQTGIAGSLVIHAVLLLLFALVFGSEAGRSFFTPPETARPVTEPEVTLVFPEQMLLLPPPEPEPKKPQPFIRTTQNQASTVKPANAAFQSDRNTIAASMLPPEPGTLSPMPTLNGTAPDIRELANRDYKDGEIKNDSAPLSEPVSQPPAPPPPPPSPAQPPPSQPPDQPLAKAMETMEKDPSANEGARLPLEVRKPEPQMADTPPEAPPPTPAMPQVRAPEDMPPPIVKAEPVQDDPVRQNTPKPEDGSFSPFTRTAKTPGGISREGADAVDAEATPLATYIRQVTGAVERKWHLYVRLGKDSVTFGRVRFRFFVDPTGTPQDLRILSDARDADPRMRELTLRAILDAQIPPIPAELLPTLDGGRVKIEYEAIIY